jgi:DNA-binding transcriptional MerR regulator
MEDLSQWESKKYLLEVSGVTDRQITRWHYEGLLPKPKQRRLGRGR